MIFVTVGTHEQPMNRLFSILEGLIENRTIQEKVIVQAGYTSFAFQKCLASPMFSYKDLERNMIEANLIITHGGPATIMQARMTGKIPIVVPRQSTYHEHVNNHQVDFCRRLETQGLLLAVYEIERLPHVISNYTKLTERLLQPGQENSDSSRKHLCDKLSQYCEDVWRVKNL